MESSKQGSSNRTCSVCWEKSGPMFVFPKNDEVRQKWKECLSVETVITDYMQVCFRHFKAEDIKKGSGTTGKARLVRGALPYSGSNRPKGYHSCKILNPTCVVPGCGKKPEDGVTLHLFPRLFERRAQWSTVLNLAKVCSRYTQICSDHFLATDFHSKGELKTLKPTATPSINLTLTNKNSSPRSSEPERSHNTCTDENGPPCSDGEFMPESVSDSDHELASGILFGFHERLLAVSDEGERVPEEDVVHDTCAHEVVVDNNCDQGQSIEEVISAADGTDAEVLTSVFERLSSTLQSDISDVITSPSSSSKNSSANPVSTSESENSFNCYTKSVETQTTPPKLTLFDLLQTDTQLKAFTGVTFATLNCLNKLVLELVGDSDKDTVPMKNRILLTLCKLRVNLSYECLGVLVGIDRRKCGEYFASTLHLLAAVLKHTVYWPTKEEVCLNMPWCFAKYSDTRLVLDCTEVPVISPDCLKCRIRLYSHYKKCQTVKVLVGVAPSGLITLMSKVYGGRASDKQIFEESDLVSNNLLEPYVDAIMVDKGFRIDSVCDERGIKIHRPPFIVKKQPLSEANARRNADIANARVHVERVMQRLKIFQILQGKIAWAMTPFLDEIFIVVAGLVNLSPPILADNKFLTYKKV